MADIQTTFADPFGSEIIDGIPRQQTRCKIIVFSHIDDNEFQGRINLSKDVTQCDTSKTIKGGGHASFTMVPRLNYMNYIFPNDYVYIYFDPGDGRGFIKNFFGFVDRISRTIRVDPGTGSTTTQFQVSCSDFTKAFDKTNLYFNPFIGNREDIIGEFAGTANLGGFALRTRGLAMYGSPADLVMSLLELTCGFGGQFLLPRSLQKVLQGGFIKTARRERVKWARNRLSESVRNALVPGWELGKTSEDFQKKIEAEAAKMVEDSYPDSFPGPYSPTKVDKRKLQDEFVQQLLEQRGAPKGTFSTQKWRSLTTIEAGANPQNPPHLLDMIDFRFVEWEGIDGHCTSISITWEEGSLWSLANGHSNEFLNELFCDLRPVGSGTDYSREPDEIDGNDGAVSYAPCLVMREYPFSTIEGIAPPESVKVLNKSLGLIYFGAIFSKEPNKPGRKVVQIPAMNLGLLVEGKGKALATKYLDVSVISITDIIQENIGRSDATHFNLLEIYSDVTSGTIYHSRYLTQEIQPITTAVGVARHGLRVRKHSSKYGRFGMFATRGGVDQGVNRRVLARWALMVDHWYQHEIEYLTGTITTRAFPEIRVGTRLDILERRESYYVEGVNQSWSYPQSITTTLTLSRGQRNDPFPVYVYPQRKGFEGVRNDKGRLADYFVQMDSSATSRASILLWGETVKIKQDANYVDDPKCHKKTWAKNTEGYLAADSFAPTEFKNSFSYKLDELVDKVLKEDKSLALDPSIHGLKGGGGGGAGIPGGGAGIPGGFGKKD